MLTYIHVYTIVYIQGYINQHTKRGKKHDKKDYRKHFKSKHFKRQSQDGGHPVGITAADYHVQKLQLMRKKMLCCQTCKDLQKHARRVGP